MSALSLAPRALYEEVAELLRQRIFSRELEPGSWIDELKIAEEYGISRTPLREALKVLAAEGLVESELFGYEAGAFTDARKRKIGLLEHANGGTMLLDEIGLLAKDSQTRLLALLESDAAGVVAQRASDAELAELQGLHAELEAAADDRNRFFALNERFHMRLLEIASNRWREQMVADLRKVMKLNRHNSLFKTGRIDESLAEHRAIMTALLARNAELTQQRMHEHFQNGLEAAT